MTFPMPHHSDDELDRMAARRNQYNAVCPRHPGNPQARLTYWKELYVGPTGDVHLVATGVYADGCLARVELDTDADPLWSVVGPVTP